MAEFMNDEENQDFEALLAKLRESRSNGETMPDDSTSDIPVPPPTASPALPPVVANPQSPATPPVQMDPNEIKRQAMEKLYNEYVALNNKAPNELKEAQDVQRRALLSSGMLQAGSQIAQAIAAGHGAKIGSNEEGVKTVQQIGAQNVQDLKERQKAEMDRLKLLLNKSGLGNRPQNRYVTVQDPDGKVRSKLINMDTGEVIKELGLAGYAYGTQIDPLTGLPISISKSDPSQISVNRPLSPTKKETSESDKNKEVRSDTVGDYRASQKILPKEWDNVVTKDKEGFELANRPKMTIISSLDSVTSLVDEATKNPNAAASLGGIIGSLFEPGKLTDEDAKRYVTRNGWENKAKDWTQMASKGTITPDLAKQIKQTSSVYRKEMDKIVRSNAIRYAGNTREALVNGRQVDPKVLANFYYQSDQPESPTSASIKESEDGVWIQGPSGERQLIKKDVADKYLKKSGYKKVEGPNG